MRKTITYVQGNMNDNKQSQENQSSKTDSEKQSSILESGQKTGCNTQATKPDSNIQAVGGWDEIMSLTDESVEITETDMKLINY